MLVIHSSSLGRFFYASGLEETGLGTLHNLTRNTTNLRRRNGMGEILQYCSNTPQFNGPFPVGRVCKREGARRQCIPSTRLWVMYKSPLRTSYGRKGQMNNIKRPFIVLLFTSASCAHPERSSLGSLVFGFFSWPPPNYLDTWTGTQALPSSSSPPSLPLQQ